MISDSLVMHLFQPLATNLIECTGPDREKKLCQTWSRSRTTPTNHDENLSLHYKYTEYQRKTWKTFEMGRNKTEPQTVKMPIDGYTKFVVVDITICDVHKQILGTTVQK